ncbi:hypothetical protein [Nannocystis sp.]|uniref:slr1659 superfamily regulator n=1 Tax=Nannocystis sp. TaxID=1962667 RepID=UPI002426C3C7|nr:hypothetical protein [Nannocystis sp.]MBK7826022.1 hypothetical protein [Nannocystis sp.]MBK9755443.1 hypothetical protein [Nannocystis sp.]
MSDTEIKGPGYRVLYDANSATVHFEGSLRLGTAEYEPIAALLNSVLEQRPQAITLRMTDLVFLNSSGINTLYKFAIAIRKLGGLAVHVQASSTISWQSKSLPNLRKFLPTITLTMN